MDGATDAGATNASRLYVGNIPWSTTVEDLRDLFADCGGVREVDIPTGRQGRSRGYGIVEFATEADALAAAEDEGLETASGVAGGTEGDGGCEALLGQQLSRSDGFVGSRLSVRI